MAAVAVTAASVRFHNWGDSMEFNADITSVDDGDTFAAATYGFGIIDNVIFNPTTAVVVIPTISGTTVTFDVAAGSVAGRFSVFGR